jgi:hypothetical protein
MEDVILPELLSDSVFDVCEDIFMTARVTATILWERKIVSPKQSCNESQTSSEESDDSNDTSNAGATTWIEEDKTPDLGHFSGNLGVKQIPSDPIKVSEIIELFFGDVFEMLSKETNLYYFQNQGKYDSSSKGLEWVDVSVVCATHKKRSETRYICKFCLALLHKEECFQRCHTLKYY